MRLGCRGVCDSLRSKGFCIVSLRGVEEMCETLFIDPFDLVFCQIEHNIDLFFCKK